MKNLFIYIHPRKDFGEEEKITVKIQIDNSLDLGWKREDILLVTNFPYVYNDIRSIILNEDVYYDFAPSSTPTSAIVKLFELGLIDKDELYWIHDLDAYQMEIITESELDLGKADMGLNAVSFKPRFEMGSYFFKSGARDIFGWIKEIACKYQVHEEYALQTLSTNNLLCATGTEYDARTKFVPLNIPGTENLPERIKKLNISYNFKVDILGQTYGLASKPIKVVHFHFSSDLLLDSAMYGKNSLKKPLLSKRLIKIFKNHGVKGVPFKKMKNLMIYLSPEKKFLDKQSFSSSKTEDLVKIQIDNSLDLDWKKEDIMLLTNFPYEYQGVKATVVADSLFENINDKAHKSNAIFHLLLQGVVKETELWWFHDLDVFQLRKVKSPEIDLEDTTAGFTDDGDNKLDTGSFFFRNGSGKLFEWMRNRACSLNTDDATALMSLTTTNYRNINFLYRKLNIIHNFSTQLGSSPPKNNIPERLIKIFNDHGVK